MKLLLTWTALALLLGYALTFQENVSSESSFVSSASSPLGVSISSSSFSNGQASSFEKSLSSSPGATVTVSDPLGQATAAPGIFSSSISIGRGSNRSSFGGAQTPAFPALPSSNTISMPNIAPFSPSFIPSFDLASQALPSSLSLFSQSNDPSSGTLSSLSFNSNSDASSPSGTFSSTQLSPFQSQEAFAKIRSNLNFQAPTRNWNLLNSFQMPRSSLSYPSSLGQNVIDDQIAKINTFFETGFGNGRPSFPGRQPEVATLGSSSDSMS